MHLVLRMDVLDRDTRIRELTCVGDTSVSQGIELGRQQECGGHVAQILRGKREEIGIAWIVLRRHVVFQRPPYKARIQRIAAAMLVIGRPAVAHVDYRVNKNLQCRLGCAKIPEQQCETGRRSAAGAFTD